MFSVVLSRYLDQVVSLDLVGSVFYFQIRNFACFFTQPFELIAINSVPNRDMGLWLQTSNDVVFGLS